MTRYIIRRLLQAIPTFFGITCFSFLIIMSAPGDPVALITFNPYSTAAQSALLRKQLGLDQPIVLQYLTWLFGNDWQQVSSGGSDGAQVVYGTRHGILRGDLGNSILQKRPVLDLIAERIPATLQLTLTALIVGYGLGIPLGLLAAVYHGRWFDQLARVLSVLGSAIPGFWLGLIFIIVFSVNLRWLPMSGMSDITRGDSGFDLIQTIRYMLMPVTVLSLGTIAVVSRFARTEALEALSQDYIRTAYAKGLRSPQVWRRHLLRNALLPIATLIGPALGGLLGGAVVVEQVFGWPGMGRLVITAVFQRDYPLVMGSVVIGAVLFIMGVLLSDILYAWLDPRIRLR